ncbi:MAG: fasciclin domain-containing protein [Pseudomonadota bacterium]
MATITGIATTNDAFNILVSALTFVDDQLNTSLVATLDDATQDLTVFAPTDAAFGQLAADLGFMGDVTDETAVTNFIVGALPAETIRDVLLYHVSGGSKSAQEVRDLPAVETLLGTDITPEGPTLGDLEPDLLDASISTGDVAADNGVVHIIDRVMLPIDVAGNDAPTITDIVAASGNGFDNNDGDFDILLAAVTAADLAGALADESADLTVFAPTDAAFIGLAQNLGFTGSDEAGATTFILDALDLLSGGNAIDLLSQVLTYHVAPQSLQSSQVAEAATIATLQGGLITVNLPALGDAAPLPDPNLVQLDIQAANGIVHVIDGVLLPVNPLAGDGAGDVDIIFDGDGDGRIFSREDIDYVAGEGGDDLIAGGRGDDVLFGGGNDDHLFGGRGDDLLDGGNGTDKLFGKQGDDELFAGAGDDILLGEGDNDFLAGGRGDDTLFGGGGDDTLDGGRGDDLLFSGGGSDVLIFEENGGEDVVIGFSGQRDKIDVSDFGFADFAAVQSVLTDENFATKIEVGNASMLLIGSNIHNLTEDNFIL